jgi:aminoglycoside phosphotransferase (APT) family kinase protein
MKMHDDEVDIDAGLIRRLVAAQFPGLAGLPVSEVRSTGTVNAIYRIGEHRCARLPRVERWARSLTKESYWLPRIAPGLTLRVPEPIAMGEPDAGYPFPWAIFDWIDGQQYADELVADERRAATELARFVTELQGTAVSGDAPDGGRQPLRELDYGTRQAIAAGRGVIDSDAALAAWERALEAPAWDGTPAWIHTDLLRPNLIVDGGELRAVIDFGGAGVGDPATDVIAAWAVFGPAGRRTRGPGNGLAASRCTRRPH